MRDPGAADDTRIFEHDRRPEQFVEERDALAEEYGYQVDMDLIEEASVQDLLSDVGTVHSDRFLACDGGGPRDGWRYAVSDKCERRARVLRDPLLRNIS